MTFLFNQKVLFKHCDPAGIVFYPRYFEMMNDAVEEYFAKVLHTPFEKLLERGGVPTVQVECTFSAPSRHGDQLIISLTCTRLGRSSLELHYEAACDLERRFMAKSTLVYIDKSGKPAAWPEPIRTALQHLSLGEN